MPDSWTNFVTYLPSPTSESRVGHLDFSTQKITPLSFPSGTFLTSLYQVVNADKGTSFIPSSRHGGEIPLSSVTVLPPLPERDVLAVGKNYSEHAKEFNSSGYDSSDKVDIPTYPVIFTKRASSIIASGVDIYPHPEWTETLDYEGEIGVIFGKEGFRVKEEDAWNYVWGFTIINDLTARERQRDHKQFFLGKSADTFCPMGPIAVPLSSLPDFKSLRLTTKVNNELRQDSNLTQLIFPIPTLIATISSSITIRPGDVLATGTPAGVGIGHSPPNFLKPGDTITVSVPGLGTLTNTVSTLSRCPPKIHHISAPNSTRKGLTQLVNSEKLVHIERFGNLSSRDAVIFIHGLGGSTDFYRAAVTTIAEESRQLILYDLEGHGLSPTNPESMVSLDSYSTDLQDLISTLGLDESSIVFAAHSFGCLVALNYFTKFKSKIDFRRLLFISLPPIPLPVAEVEELYKLAEKVREHGMLSAVDDLVTKTTSPQTQANNPLAIAYIRTILANTDSEGYAKGCVAWASAQIDSVIDSPDLLEASLFVGEEDTLSSKPYGEIGQPGLGGLKVEVLKGVGQWCALENVEGFASQFFHWRK